MRYAYMQTSIFRRQKMQKNLGEKKFGIRSVLIVWYRFSCVTATAEFSHNEIKTAV